MLATNSKSQDIKKAVEALAIVPTRDKLTVLCRKIYNIMMFHAQQQGVETQIFRIELRRVVQNLDFHSNNTEVLKEHLRQMVTTKVEWQSPTTGEGARWGVAALIAHAELTNIRGESWMEWSYAPTIKQAILDPERYAKINLENQAALKTMAALALYEICARYIDNPGGVTAKQTLDWWRPVLTGDPASKEQGAYLDWKIFNRDVVKKAVTEINLVTDIEVSQITYKRGRSVAELQFKVNRKGRSKKPLEGISPINLNALGRAINAGVHQDKAEKLLERHGENRFNAALNELENRISNKVLGPIRMPEKYLSVILEAPQISQKEVIETKNSLTAKDEKARHIALLEKYRESKRADIFSIFKEMTSAMQKDYLREFEMSVVSINPALKKTWESKKLEGAMSKSFFVSFLGESMWGKGWDNPSDSELLNFKLSDVS